jgi:predicted site-specific integrase-resolvase
MLSEPVSLESLRSLLDDFESDRLMSLADAADYLEVDADELRGWARAGLIPSQRVAGRFVFKVRDVVRWEVDGRIRLRGAVLA